MLFSAITAPQNGYVYEASSDLVERGSCYAEIDDFEVLRGAVLQAYNELIQVTYIILLRTLIIRLHANVLFLIDS